MFVKKNRDSMVCTSAILMVIVAEIVLFSASSVRAHGQEKATAKRTFQTKCAMCHGPDGAGSEAGKSLNVPDLRSPEVQKLPDADLAKGSAECNGGVPQFKGSINEAE